jgi:hypothetical protein
VSSTRSASARAIVGAKPASVGRPPRAILDQVRVRFGKSRRVGDVHRLAGAREPGRDGRLRAGAIAIRIDVSAQYDALRIHQLAGDLLQSITPVRRYVQVLGHALALKMTLCSFA